MTLLHCRKRCQMGSIRPTHCADCRYPMQHISRDALLDHLNEPQRVAQKLGSAVFHGWQCPNCSQLNTQEFHLVTYVSNSSRFRECPTCKELTVTHTEKVVKNPTEYSSGKRTLSEECHCCSYRRHKEETIPRLPPPPSNYSGGGGFSGGSFSTGGGGGDGCSGGSFGGGSSGGGGGGSF